MLNVGWQSNALEKFWVKKGSGIISNAESEAAEEEISNIPLVNIASWIKIPPPNSPPSWAALTSKYTQSPEDIEPEFNSAVISYDPVNCNGLVFTFCKDWVRIDSAWIVGL